MPSQSWKSNNSLEASGVRAVGWQLNMHSYEWSPPTDVYETDASFVVRVEAAGMSDAEFRINVEENFLIISGFRIEPTERRVYHQMEIRFGEFSTAVELPAGVDVSKAQAEYDDGFLSVVLPKIAPTNIDIKG